MLAHPKEMNGWKKKDWMFEKKTKLSFPGFQVFLYKTRGPRFVFGLFGVFAFSGLSGVEAPERKVYSNIMDPSLGRLIGEKN